MIKLPEVKIDGGIVSISGDESALRALGEALLLKAKHKENLRIAIRANDNIIKIFYEK
jgi:hypothetical protein